MKEKVLKEVTKRWKEEKTNNFGFVTKETELQNEKEGKKKKTGRKETPKEWNREIER